MFIINEDSYIPSEVDVECFVFAFDKCIENERVRKLLVLYLKKHLNENIAEFLLDYSKFKNVNLKDANNLFEKYFGFHSKYQLNVGKNVINATTLNINHIITDKPFEVVFKELISNIKLNLMESIFQPFIKDDLFVSFVSKRDVRFFSSIGSFHKDSLLSYLTCDINKSFEHVSFGDVKFMKALLQNNAIWDYKYGHADNYSYLLSTVGINLDSKKYSFVQFRHIFDCPYEKILNYFTKDRLNPFRIFENNMKSPRPVFGCEDSGLFHSLFSEEKLSSSLDFRGKSTISTVYDVHLDVYYIMKKTFVVGKSLTSISFYSIEPSDYDEKTVIRQIHTYEHSGVFSDLFFGQSIKKRLKNFKDKIEMSSHNNYSVSSPNLSMKSPSLFDLVEYNYTLMPKIMSFELNTQ